MSGHESLAKKTVIVIFTAELLLQNTIVISAAIPGGEKQGSSEISEITGKLSTRPEISHSNSRNSHSPPGMVWIPGGEFSMGLKTSHSISGGFRCQTLGDALPAHRVTVDGFWMDKTDVTNAEFEKFVKSTGYRTTAEQQPAGNDCPGVPKENLSAGSLVFTPPSEPVSLNDAGRWWRYVPGANWRHPLGPQSTIQGHENDPVVQVSYEDAMAYASWSGKRLPTEAEFEFAQKGGEQEKSKLEEDQLCRDGRWLANTFQGSFPEHDVGEDGHTGISPVKSYPPNGYGLYDMIGNVWQWCSDLYNAEYSGSQEDPGKIVKNPRGPASSFDPNEPGVTKHVLKGGSFLCNGSYCRGYLPGSRSREESKSASNHIGFRCVKSD